MAPDDSSELTPQVYHPDVPQTGDIGKFQVGAGVPYLGTDRLRWGNLMSMGY